MMSSEHIIEVNETNFQIEVLAYSNTIPVVVDFWAEWCQPCHMLSPILEKLTKEADGAFRLAKINADENPNLTMQFNIRGLPTVKAFYKGQVVDEFTGAQTEGKVREFVRLIAPSANDLSLEKGQSLLSVENWGNAAVAFRKVLKTHPDDSAALLGLAKSLIAQGKASDALAILNEFPASKEYTAAKNLLPLAKAMAARLMEQAAGDQDDLNLAYMQAIHLVGRGNLPAAADGLLGILQQDKNFRAGEARQVILSVLELMAENKAETRKYRSELASILF